MTQHNEHTSTVNNEPSTQNETCDNPSCSLCVHGRTSRDGAYHHNPNQLVVTCGAGGAIWLDQTDLDTIVWSSPA